jgi:hypothetical protein
LLYSVVEAIRAQLGTLKRRAAAETALNDLRYIRFGHFRAVRVAVVLKSVISPNVIALWKSGIFAFRRASFILNRDT